MSEKLGSFSLRHRPYGRGLSPDITTPDKLWCVYGTELNWHNRVIQSGLLDYAYDEEDAMKWIKHLESLFPDRRFINLRARPYQEQTSTPIEVDEDDLPTEEKFI